MKESNTNMKKNRYDGFSFLLYIFQEEEFERLEEKTKIALDEYPKIKNMIFISKDKFI
jgi:hypothetical protein